jgi:hypothetical protein
MSLHDGRAVEMVPRSSPVPGLPILDRAPPGGGPGVRIEAVQPCPAAAVHLIRRRFLIRTDRLCFIAPWKKPCPLHGGPNLIAMLLAHLLGERAPEVEVRWATKAGKSGLVRGRFRLGAYSPSTDGATLFGCVDCDGGGRHSCALVDPLHVALAIRLKAKQFGLASHLERSGGGKGWHVWLFFAEPQRAADVRRLLFALLPTGAHLTDGTLADPRANRGIEVFPKQDSIGPDGVGSMVWLPWWHGAAEGCNQFHRFDDLGNLEPYAPDDFALVAAAELASALGQIDAPRKAHAETTGKAERWGPRAQRAGPGRPRGPAAVALALAALRLLDPRRTVGYADWLHVGMALQAVDSSEAMLRAWDEWSQSCEAKYEPGVCADKWASFRAGGGLGLTDLLRWARQDSARGPCGPRLAVRCTRRGPHRRHGVIRFSFAAGGGR